MIHETPTLLKKADALGVFGGEVISSLPGESFERQGVIVLNKWLRQWSTN